MRLNKILKYHLYFLLSFLIISCGNNSEIEILDEVEVEEIIEDVVIIENDTINILALGDSYTIGQSVCAKCRFPEQLIDSLNQRNDSLDLNLKIIATTGWTTGNLINAIDSQNINANFDLVTLLIGVNNQYRGLPFATFEEEFPILVDKAIKAVNLDRNKLIVLSIPDYAYTPFGNGNTTISSEIEKYNNHIELYCQTNSITFLNITDITQDGLSNPDYVASDGLHPSKEAYTEFVKRLLPLATQKLGL